MPKKRAHNFIKQLQGSSSSKQTAANNGDDNSPSVNERLSELRKLEGKDAAAKKRLLAESVSQRSVPPDVSSILSVPESAPPKPKVGVRLRDRMRTPGPAPPKSWLAGSSSWTTPLSLRGGRRGLKRSADVAYRNRPKQLQRFAHLTGQEATTAGSRPSSLLHLSLKAIAESWFLFDDDDYHAFAEVPMRLRLKLLSYISFYGSALTLRQLEAVLQGSENITSLDLAGLTGHLNLTLKKLGRIIDKEPEGSSHVLQEAVVESWDAEISFETALRSMPSVSRFSGLTHLCLSHPGPGVSWRDLLSLVKSVSQVTHLSLAYWPRPTLTPNLATATVSSRNSPDVTAGGSHYYSTLDQDMTEPAALLRQLSAHFLCLQWLDLEGCQEWIPALELLTRKAAHSGSMLPGSPSLTDGWTANTSTTQSVLTSNWKNLAYVRCSQGWFPSLVGIQALTDTATSASQRMMRVGIERHLRDVMGETSCLDLPTNDARDVERKRARMWLESEYNVVVSNDRIHRARRSEGCKAIEMDFGWPNRDDDYTMMTMRRALNG
ncbi:hypothetical protein LTR09_007234 [Extremus antarcticus]|uniref:Tafazzin n=1 Tax=Extremus antarcticus TaxID=702011 RepID=A0AAJ0GD36_9PEZI|nr:hypothetical protein LTR09_007234 [Extremus antarcticus]